ncbi:dephospho-CoA kinase [Blattabacterium sp. DPU]|uniref:dephospho-CoA kinase n=1 Tax=Blattabacterium sp. DPU TaxID=2715232 RepID=UPI0014080D81|nr:dephospho-CoA kinase [Blattabacterium sp. DPU]QIK16583.1 dephospho-CoA kinase [Blattabacterium sp. DPU]
MIKKIKNRKIKLIGITGKMGSGKSLFSSFFKKKGIPVYHSDQRGKILMNKIEILKKNIIKYFGKNSYNKKKDKINKTYLSQIVFKNPIALKLLCNIVHPWIFLDFQQWMSSFSQKRIIYVIKESAILFDTGSYKECDFIINVNSSNKNIIERIIKRDNLNENQIVNRLKNQISNEKREKKSDFIINNNYLSSYYLQYKSDRIHKLLEKLILQHGKR